MKDIIQLLDELKNKLNAMIFEIEQIKKDQLKTQSFTIEVKDSSGKVVKVINI